MLLKIQLRKLLNSSSSTITVRPSPIQVDTVTEIKPEVSRGSLYLFICVHHAFVPCKSAD